MSDSDVKDLLAECESDFPPFNKSIDSALLSSSVSTSRFQFASHLHQALESTETNLSPKQRLCALCAIHQIGKTFSTENEENAFSSYLKNRHEAFSQLDSKTSLNKRDYYGAFLPFHRPSPPPFNHKLHFVHTPYPSIRYQWLPDLSHQLKNEQSLLALAMEQQLDLEQERVLLSVDKASFLMLIRELHPENTTQLVTHNPTIAIEFLLKMHEYKIESLPAHHSALANMDISLHSMEVVYKLATLRKIHPEFLHVFVMGLFSRCGSNHKKILGGREEKLVRLVAIFLQNLIQNEIINVEDFVEIQAFCIEFSKVREVQMLFKLIKSTKK